MQVTPPSSDLPPTHPARIRANARALTDSFAAAPEELDKDSGYRSPLSGRLHAYQSLNARLLRRVAEEPRIQGFGYWLNEMCRARIKSPKTQRPAAENLVRRLFELIEALYLVAETPEACIVDVGCDQTKQADVHKRAERSSDIAVVNKATRAVRHIEVTSIGAPVRYLRDLDRPVQHVVDKVYGADGRGTHEGAIALNWSDETLPEDILGEMLSELNSPTREPWRDASRNLDRLVLMRYDPEHADTMATFVREQGGWHAAVGPFTKLEDVVPAELPAPERTDSPMVVALDEGLGHVPRRRRHQSPPKNPAATAAAAALTKATARGESSRGETKL